MRGADASAGTIKSGGATRRAAKMVVLDVDHPDIVDFIETKAKEENKIRALRDAGFDMDLGGADIISVQYQNANNSVRVSDEFMNAVENGKEFGLNARLTGETIETVDAKGLFRKIAEAAWECADPGLQYDDTINNWHTNPETGRITASNPCSEYLSLDNSSCNLASLNLLKFLKADDTFDAAHFARMCELIITAMDISITFGEFPTEKIRDTTKAYRQLGIGYANLGALLMATGHAYDSDGRPGHRRRDHQPDDRERLQDVGRARQGRRPVRRLRAERGPAQARHADARRRQRRRRAGRELRQGHPRPGQQDLAGVPHPGRGQRLPQRPGQPARADRHHRLHDGLRHHRHRARPRPGQVQEAGRRRFHADRQPDRAARAEEPRLPARAGRGDHRVHRRARPRGQRPRPAPGALRGVRLRDGRALDHPDGPRPDDGRRPAVPVRLHLQDGQHAGERDRRGRRGDLLRGLEARPQGAGHLPRQLQGRPAAVRQEEDRGGSSRKPHPFRLLRRRRQSRTSTARSAGACPRPAPRP